MTTDPDQLRREIEGTQRNLGTDVDALTEKVTPGRIVQRRVGRARGMARDLRDRVMGGGSDAAGDKMRSVADSASSAADTVSDTVQDAPDRIRRGTEGNPLAAGLIAFGAGWLVSSLVPASGPEQRLAGQVKDAAGPVTERLGSAAQEVKENLREPAQQAVESVRSTASDAASTVTDETKSTAQDVRGTAQDAKGTVQQHAR